MARPLIGDRDWFGGCGFAVDDERHGALRGGSAVARDDGLYVDGLGILAPDLAGGVNGFDSPVGFGFGDYGVRNQFDVGGQGHVGERCREVSALHVAEEMKLDGRVDRFGEGTDGAREFTESAVAIAGLDGLHGGTQERIDPRWAES